MLGANATLVENLHYGSDSFSSRASLATPSSVAGIAAASHSAAQARVRVITQATQSSVDAQNVSSMPSKAAPSDPHSGFDTRVPATPAAAPPPKPNAFSNPNYAAINGTYSTVKELK